MRFDCIPPEFSPFRNLKKNQNKKNRPTDPIFRFWSGEGNITIFFFGLMTLGDEVTTQFHPRISPQNFGKSLTK